MKLAGLQKLTLLDFPGHVACTVFTAGCNLRCPFCHNSDLVLPGRTPPQLSEEEVLSFLKKRQGVLQGVALTGGEPLLHADCGDFLRRVREMGFSVKLDTNGTLPHRLRTVVEEGLVDYVAMDIKNCPRRYAETVGVPGFDLSGVEESARYLMSGAVDFEFRTTVTAQHHDAACFDDIGQWLAGDHRHAIQNFSDSGDVLQEGLSPCTPEQLDEFLTALRAHVPGAFVRGSDDN